jgi:hypothetical protein
MSGLSTVSTAAPVASIADMKGLRGYSETMRKAGPPYRYG